MYRVVELSHIGSTCAFLNNETNANSAQTNAVRRKYELVECLILQASCRLCCVLTLRDGVQVWDVHSLGAASFTTLRAYGAFLVSASISADGTVAPVTIVSEVGSACVVESPWASGLVVKDSSGHTVTTTTKGKMVSFPTTAGMTYTLSSASGYWY